MIWEKRNIIYIHIVEFVDSIYRKLSSYCTWMFLLPYLISICGTYLTILAPAPHLDPAKMIPMRQWPTYSMVYKFVLSNMRILAWIVDRLWGNCIHLWVYKVYKLCQTQNVREDMYSKEAFSICFPHTHTHTNTQLKQSEIERERER